MSFVQFVSFVAPGLLILRCLCSPRAVKRKTLNVANIKIIPFGISGR